MLLRRIKHHVQNENWFAVCVDFFIVVVGVYVGLEVSNINEERQERDRAVSYLERIRADLVTDIEQAGGTYEFWSQVISYGEDGIAHAEQGTLAGGSISETLLAYYQASQVDLYSAIDTTYLELKGAAEFRLIPNEELLSELANYYILSNGPQSSHLLKFSPAYREYVRGMVPWDVQKYIWANCHDTDSINQYLVACEIPIDDSKGQAVLQQLVDDPRTLQYLRFWMANLSVAQGVLETNAEDAAKLVKKIDVLLDEIS